jgi:hypothetical protein
MNIVFVDFIEFYDVLVVHLLQNIDFSLEPLNFFRVIDWLLFDKLYSSFKLTYFVYASTNFAEWALAELFFYFVDVSEVAFSLFYERNLRYFVQMCTRIVGNAWLTWTIWCLRSLWLTILIIIDVRFTRHFELFSLVVIARFLQKLLIMIIRYTMAAWVRLLILIDYVLPIRQFNGLYSLIILNFLKVFCAFTINLFV